MRPSWTTLTKKGRPQKSGGVQMWVETQNKKQGREERDTCGQLCPNTGESPSYRFDLGQARDLGKVVQEMSGVYNMGNVFGPLLS